MKKGVYIINVAGLVRNNTLIFLLSIAGYAVVIILSQLVS
jgi:hypothetical protein